jgi:hypothetical protein
LDEPHHEPGVERVAHQPDDRREEDEDDAALRLEETRYEAEDREDDEGAADQGRGVIAVDRHRLVDDVSDADPAAWSTGGFDAAILSESAQKSWFSPANISDTESSAKMRRIESARVWAAERTTMLSGLPARSWAIVSVTTIRSIPESS